MALPASISLPSRTTLGLGALGGILHLALVAGVWLRFGFTTRVQGNELALVYTGIGAVLLGSIPVVLLVAKRLVTPVVVVAVLGVLSAHETWSTYVAPDVAPAPVDPTPFGWYLLGWFVVLAVALLVGAGEYGIRHVRTDGGPPDSPSTDR